MGLDQVNNSTIRRLPEKYRCMTVQEAFSFYPDENDEEIPLGKLASATTSLQEATSRSAVDKKAEEMQKRLQEMLKKQADMEKVEAELKIVSQNFEALPREQRLSQVDTVVR